MICILTFHACMILDVCSMSPKAILHNSFHKCVVITLKKSAVRKGSNITHLKVKYDAWKRNSKS